MSAHLLSSGEVEQLTGAKRPAIQRRVLDKAGIRYVKRLDGAPALTWDSVNNALAMTRPNPEGDQEPRLESFHGPKTQRR
ncbi:DUF4224 domain-containing protein [Methylolobus aquaticus]|nr:DUF4224 domain-containing protein [Methylolobus aquaticus]